MASSYTPSLLRRTARLSEGILASVRQGVIAARIAGHAADIVKGVKGAREWDLKMSQARKRLDWEEQARLAIDPARASQVHGQGHTAGEACSMCGRYCAMDLMEEYLGITAEKC